MRMCILGGGGYLGQLLAQALQNEGGHFVVLFDLNFFASFPHIKLNEELTQRIEGSIERSDQLIEALTGCDACFHLAGYGMSGGPSLNKEKCFAINYWGTKNVIEICKNLGVSRLVFTSSALLLSEQSLRYPNSPAAGNKYHIVDGALNYSSNCIRAPYSVIYAFAFLCELLYRWFGIEPHLTRFECAIVGVTNTFSCQRAMRDFGYNPIRSHDLHSTIDFCLKQKEVQLKLKSRQQINENDNKKYPIDLTVPFSSIFSPINWIWVAWIVDSICSTKVGSVAHQTSTFVAAHRWWTFF
uniref:3-beta hydroxysteroid dehydrogenase/isomerase domain-containing protein n=1 Tax=Meloidogyne javanica TaxID=6303 RepID=A0A915MW49_MELJA